ncbi:hypothetical protein FZEAL_10346 [Fusarium zealandicum]|uniref:CFEM domain-containing protein n=1 Tax=Fusarium zealandicum TaxID=1053134 RepID=A0A8H4XBW4_9HYPO|nr:hypothetical protein FZEAL_10346 [Fusarium zealandicum]
MVLSCKIALAIAIVSQLGLVCVAQQMSLAGIPTCAISCMAQALPQTSCSPTDQGCLCSDPQFNAAVAPCIQANCTIPEGLIVMNTTVSMCGLPSSDESSELSWVGGSVTIVVAIFMSMRITTKICRLSAWNRSDMVLIIAFVSAEPVLKQGLGKDTWALQPQEITAIFKILFRIQFLYFIGLALVKASMLFFFLEIFPDRTIRRILWGLQAINMITALTFVIIACAQCQPISHFWDGWSGDHKASQTTSVKVQNAMDHSILLSKPGEHLIN